MQSQMDVALEKVREACEQLDHWIQSVHIGSFRLPPFFELLIDIPKGNENDLYELADLYGKAAKLHGGHAQDVSTALPDVFNSWTGDGAPTDAESQLSAYIQQTGNVSTAHGNMQNLVQQSAMEVESTKYMAIISIVMMLITLYQAIATLIATLGASSLEGAGAVAVCKEAMRVAFEDLVKKLASLGTKQGMKTLVKLGVRRGLEFVAFSVGSKVLISAKEASEGHMSWSDWATSNLKQLPMEFVDSFTTGFIGGPLSLGLHGAMPEALAMGGGQILDNLFVMGRNQLFGDAGSDWGLTNPGMTWDTGVGSSMIFGAFTGTFSHVGRLPEGLGSRLAKLGMDDLDLGKDPIVPKDPATDLDLDQDLGSSSTPALDPLGDFDGEDGRVETPTGEQPPESQSLDTQADDESPTEQPPDTQTDASADDQTAQDTDATTDSTSTDSTDTDTDTDTDSTDTDSTDTDDTSADHTSADHTGTDDASTDHTPDETNSGTSSDDSRSQSNDQHGDGPDATENGSQPGGPDHTADTNSHGGPDGDTGTAGAHGDGPAPGDGGTGHGDASHQTGSDQSSSGHGGSEHAGSQHGGSDSNGTADSNGNADSNGHRPSVGRRLLTAWQHRMESRISRGIAAGMDHRISDDFMGLHAKDPVTLSPDMIRDAISRNPDDLNAFGRRLQGYMATHLTMLDAEGVRTPLDDVGIRETLKKLGGFKFDDSKVVPRSDERTVDGKHSGRTRDDRIPEQHDAEEPAEPDVEAERAAGESQAGEHATTDEHTTTGEHITTGEHATTDGTEAGDVPPAAEKWVSAARDVTDEDYAWGRTLLGRVLDRGQGDTAADRQGVWSGDRVTDEAVKRAEAVARRVLGTRRLPHGAKDAYRLSEYVRKNLTLEGDDTPIPLQGEAMRQRLAELFSGPGADVPADTAGGKVSPIHAEGPARFDTARYTHTWVGEGRREQSDAHYTREARYSAYRLAFDDFDVAQHDVDSPRAREAVRAAAHDLAGQMHEASVNALRGWLLGDEMAPAEIGHTATAVMLRDGTLRASSSMKEDFGLTHNKKISSSGVPPADVRSRDYDILHKEILHPFIAGILDRIPEDQRSAYSGWCGEPSVLSDLARELDARFDGLSDEEKAAYGGDPNNYLADQFNQARIVSYHADGPDFGKEQFPCASDDLLIQRLGMSADYLDRIGEQLYVDPDRGVIALAKPGEAIYKVAAAVESARDGSLTVLGHAVARDGEPDIAFGTEHLSDVEVNRLISWAVDKYGMERPTEVTLLACVDPEATDLAGGGAGLQPFARALHDRGGLDVVGAPGKVWVSETGRIAVGPADETGRAPLLEPGRPPEPWIRYGANHAETAVAIDEYVRPSGHRVIDLDTDEADGGRPGHGQAQDQAPTQALGTPHGPAGHDAASSGGERWVPLKEGATGGQAPVPHHWAGGGALAAASDAEAREFMHDYVHRVSAGYDFTSNPAGHTAAEALPREPDTIKIAASGRKDGSIVLDDKRISRVQFVRELKRMVDGGEIELKPGERITLVICYSGEGTDSTAAQLAREIGHPVSGPTTRVWTYRDGRETVASADPANRRMPVDPPDGTWHTFDENGNLILTPAVREPVLLVHREDGSLHAVGDPPGTYRLQDDPTTLRDAATGHPLGPVSGTIPGKPAVHFTEVYQPSASPAELGAAKDALAQATTAQQVRAARVELYRESGRTVLSDKYGLPSGDLVADGTRTGARGRDLLALAAYDRDQHRLVVLETSPNSPHRMPDGALLRRGSPEYIENALRTGTQLRLYLDSHPDLHYELIRRGSIDVEVRALRVGRDGTIRLSDASTMVFKGLPEPRVGDPERLPRTHTSAESTAAALDPAHRPPGISVSTADPNRFTIGSGGAHYDVEILDGTGADTPPQVVRDPGGGLVIQVGGRVVDHLTDIELQAVLTRGIGRVEGEPHIPSGAKHGSPILSRDSLPSRPRLRVADYVGLSEFDAMARARHAVLEAHDQHLDANRPDLAARDKQLAEKYAGELSRFIDEHGLRAGMADADTRFRLATEHLGEQGRAALGELRDAARAPDVAVATVRQHLAAGGIKGMTIQVEKIPGRDVFKIIPDGWHRQARAGFSFEVKSGDVDGGAIAEFRVTRLDRHFDLVIKHGTDLGSTATRRALEDVLRNQITTQHGRPPVLSLRKRDIALDETTPIASDAAATSVSLLDHNLAASTKIQVNSASEVAARTLLRIAVRMAKVEHQHDKMLYDELGAPERPLTSWTDRLAAFRSDLAAFSGITLGDRSTGGHSGFGEHNPPPISQRVRDETASQARTAIEDIGKDLDRHPTKYIRGIDKHRALRSSLGRPSRDAAWLRLKGGPGIWLDVETGHTKHGQIDHSFVGSTAKLTVPPQLHDDPAAMKAAMQQELDKVASRQLRTQVDNTWVTDEFAGPIATDGIPMALNLKASDTQGRFEALEAAGASALAGDAASALTNPFLRHADARAEASAGEFDGSNRAGLTSEGRGEVAGELRDSTRAARTALDDLHEQLDPNWHAPAAATYGSEFDAVRDAISEINHDRHESGGHWEQVKSLSGRNELRYRAGQHKPILDPDLRIKVAQTASAAVEIRRTRTDAFEITIRPGTDPAEVRRQVHALAENILDRRFRGTQGFMKYVARSALNTGGASVGIGSAYLVTHNPEFGLLGAIAVSAETLRGGIAYLHEIHMSNQALERALVDYDADEAAPSVLRTDYADRQRSVEDFEEMVAGQEVQLRVHLPAEMDRLAHDYPAYHLDREILPQIDQHLGGADLPRDATVETVDGSEHTYRVTFRASGRRGRPIEFTFDVGTGKHGGDPVEWFRVGSDVHHSLLVDPTIDPKETAASVHRWVAERINDELQGPSGTEGAKMRTIKAAVAGVTATAAGAAVVIVDAVTHSTVHTIFHLGQLAQDVIQQGAAAGSGAVGAGVREATDAGNDVQASLAGARIGQRNALHFGTPTEAQLEYFASKYDAQAERMLQAYDRYLQLRELAASLPADQRPALLALPLPVRGYPPFHWEAADSDLDSPGPLGGGQASGAGAGWPIFDEIPLGEWLDASASPIGGKAPTR